MIHPNASDTATVRSVFVVGDPWLYNEYTDRRELSSEYENLIAGDDLSRWLLDQAK